MAIWKAASLNRPRSSWVSLFLWQYPIVINRLVERFMEIQNPQHSAQNIFEIASYHATSRVPIASPSQTVGQLRNSMFGRTYDCASVVVVCESDTFLGVLRIEDFIASSLDRKVADIMDAGAPYVKPGADQEMAAWHAVKGGQSALSVVDEHGRFVGIISPDRLLAVLLQEHDEDMARLGGFLKNSTIARLASEESVRRRFWHRLPWLVLGLLGFFIAADIIAYFEVALKEKLVLAFFIPGIVYLADAVGTQTETVVIRGLSVGIGIGRVVLLEAITGLVIGLALSVIAAPFIFWRWGDADVALAVGLSIFTACSIATVVAMLIPWVLSRFSIDPAFGSGPVATVVQDLLSISLYFLIAILVTA